MFESFTKIVNNNFFNAFSGKELKIDLILQFLPSKFVKPF